MSEPDALEATQQLLILQSYGLDEQTAALALGCAIGIGKQGGPATEGLWRIPPQRSIAGDEGLHDELMLFATELMAINRAVLIDDNVHDWAEQYASTFGYFARSILQSVESVDLLLGAHCYLDAFSICRTLIGRVNYLLLFALNPWLFDDWYARPTNERYLDGHVRDVLSALGLEFFGRLYAELSEAIHHQPEFLTESGYFEAGLFAPVAYSRTRLLVCAKLLVGSAVCIGVAAARQDYEGKRLPKETELACRLFDQTVHLLDPGRLEHLSTTISPDRHWSPVGKNKWAIFNGLKPEAVADQLAKFHRDSGQRKSLRSPYDFSIADAERQREDAKQRK
jgi:hypothetical protein